MNKLFVFQDNNNKYCTELKAGFNFIKGARKIDLNELNADYLINNKIDIVIANGLPKEWYFILKGLSIVTITIDSINKYHDLSDIVIDSKSEDNNKYFTGKRYSIVQNKGLLFGEEIPFVEIVNLITKLNWDSDFFGFPIAYLSSRYLTEAIMFRSLQFIKKHNIKLVEYLCNCHDRKSVLIAERNKFDFVDIRLTYEKKISEAKKIVLPDGINFGLAEKKDIEILKQISKNMYMDSRYFFDGKFDLKKVNEFYQSWVEKAVKGIFDDKCFCLFDDQEAIGFCSIKYNEMNAAKIGVVGLASRYQGKGLAQRMLTLVFNELIKEQIGKLYVVTQGRNYAAQRLYQKVGFLTKSTELWYHKWY